MRGSTGPADHIHDAPWQLAHRLEDRRVTTRALDRARSDARLSVQVERAARTVALAGEFDFSAVPRLLEDVASFGEPGDIIIDLTELTFIDASGLGAAVRIRNSQLADGFDLHIVRANRLVTRVFTLGGVAQLLETPHAARQPQPALRS